MKTVWILLGICSCGVIASASSSRLWFLNGDSLKADFIDQEGASTQLEFPWHPDPVSVPSRLIDRIDLGTSRKADAGPHRFFLTNGDSLRGTLLSLNQEEARVKTNWGPEVIVSRNQIEQISFSESGGGLFHGRGRLKDWNVTKDATRHHVQSTGRVTEGPHGLLMQGRVTISKKLPLPEEGLTLEVGMKFEGRYPNLTILMDDLLVENGQRAGLHLYFSQSTIYGRTMMNNRNTMDWRIRISEVPDLLLGEPRIVVTVDPRTTQMALWINNVKLHQWSYKDTKVSSRKHFTLQLTSGNPNSDSWVTDVSLMRGVVPPSQEQSNPQRMDADALLLGNQDTLKGSVEQVKNHAVYLRIPGRETPLPVQTKVVSRIDFQSLDRVIPKRLNEDIRVSFQDGSTMTVQILQADENGFLVKSGAVKDAFRVPLRHIQILDYNPYSPHTPPMGDRWMLEQLEALH